MQMGTEGFPMMVVQGVRTTEQQQVLFAQGRTTPGPIVTYCDGIKYPSNHQLKPDGWGHAVDIAFQVDGKPSWDAKLPWHSFGLIVRQAGCRWGGDFSHPDLDHVEME